MLDISLHIFYSEISQMNNSATPNMMDQDMINEHKQDQDQLDYIKQQDEKKVVQQEIIPSQSTQQTKIKLYIVDEQQNSVTFKCKPSNKLQKLFQTYAENRGTLVNEIRFFYNGKKLNGDMTIADAGLSEDCTINVLRQQVGGFE